ncbi:MAG: LL-diaminopimelate aminotransferase [Candidatus Saganbacteria bacterium]|nr:LL-diaminopimelate aminotransferase [Candidatus Saganbacteria bacterium]
MKKTNRISKIPKYLFAEIDKKKSKAQAKGADIIDLSVGDPDQPTPQYIIDALNEALKDPSTHNYPPYEGIKEFRSEVASWYKRRFNVELDPDREVMSLIGSKEGIAHIMFALLDPGDISLIPDPSYPVYKMCTLLAGGEPYYMPLTKENNFIPDLKVIPSDIAKKTKLMFINYPNNPTSAVAPESFLKEAVKFCKNNDIVLCSDLAYSEVTFSGYRAQSILEIHGAKEIAIEFHSLSKTYNMTGWRIGMAAGNADVIKALAIVKTNIDSGVFKAVQKAAVRALSGSDEFTKKMNLAYEKRMKVLIDGLNSLGWELPYTKATFYVWAPVPAGLTSEKFCSILLEKCGVLIVPGSGYGSCGEGYVRVCITAEEKRIEQAIARMRQNNISFK